MRGYVGCGFYFTNPIHTDGLAFAFGQQQEKIGVIATDQFVAGGTVPTRGQSFIATEQHGGGVLRRGALSDAGGAGQQQRMGKTPALPKGIKAGEKCILIEQRESHRLHLFKTVYVGDKNGRAAHWNLYRIGGIHTHAIRCGGGDGMGARF